VDDEPSENIEPSSRQIGCLIGAILSPVMIMVSVYNGAERGFLIVTLLGVFAMVLYVRRDIIGEDYFIAVVPPLFLSQFLLAVGCPLPEVPYYKALVMPFAIATLFLNFAIIRLAEKLLARKKDQP
jgi:asparagine N-glycosylation enzyme membrane subunit Stt3